MKTALITGGTSGIGLGIAHTLSSKNFKVIVTGLTEAEVKAADLPNNTIAKVLDVTNDAGIASFMSEIKSLDALVNCAGVIFRQGKEYEIDFFQKVIDVNLTGTMRMCVAAKPFLSKTNGSIVNIASIRSFFGGPLNPAYTASKGGVMQLTKALAVGWAQDTIRVNAIAPGWIDTPLTQALRDDKQANDTIMNRTPMKRWGKVDEIGDMAAFLISQDAKFITGTTMIVDGGYAAG